MSGRPAADADTWMPNAFYERRGAVWRGWVESLLRPGAVVVEVESPNVIEIKPLLAWQLFDHMETLSTDALEEFKAEHGVTVRVGDIGPVEWPPSVDFVRNLDVLSS